MRSILRAQGLNHIQMAYLAKNVGVGRLSINDLLSTLMFFNIFGGAAVIMIWHGVRPDEIAPYVYNVGKTLSIVYVMLAVLVMVRFAYLCNEVIDFYTPEGGPVSDEVAFRFHAIMKKRLPQYARTGYSPVVTLASYVVFAALLAGLVFNGWILTFLGLAMAEATCLVLQAITREYIIDTIKRLSNEQISMIDPIVVPVIVHMSPS